MKKKNFVFLLIGISFAIMIMENNMNESTIVKENDVEDYRGKGLMSSIKATFAVRDLGRMEYTQALDHQRCLHSEVVRGDAKSTILLVEHNPVITIGRHADKAAHILADNATLTHAGIELHQTDRGGDVTYHGPGQLVVYPIIRLNDFQLNVRRYVHLLEQAIIDTVESFGITAHRDQNATGVWVKNSDEEAKKIAAIGVRVQRWVTMHGAALNVSPSLDHYDLIVPCGLAGRGVTSLRKLLTEACPTMDEVKNVVCDVLIRRLYDGF